MLCVAVCMRADVDTRVYSIRWLLFTAFVDSAGQSSDMQDFDELSKPERKPVILIGDSFQLTFPTCDAVRVVARISEWRPTVRTNNAGQNGWNDQEEFVRM